jgi:hypothetical protein
MSGANTARLLMAATLCAASGFISLAAQQAQPAQQNQTGHPSTAAQPEVKPAPPTPIAEKKEELGKPSWDPEWDKIVEQALPPELLSSQVARDVRPFCPRFNHMTEVDRRAFWAYFFQALSGAEAGLVPTTDVRHAQPEVAVKDTVTKRKVRSEGLLQLTYMDADRYGCDFDWDKDKVLPEKDPAKTILQPRNNLTCGIKIIDNQLIALHRPLLTRKSYWSPLHPRTAPNRVLLKQMTNVPDPCRPPPKPERAKKDKGPRSTLASEAESAGR